MVRLHQRFIWIAPPVVLLLWVCSIPFWGELWHAVHKKTISYGGLTIVVPSSFYVWDSSPNVTMWRLSIGYPIFHGPFGMISVYESPINHPFEFATDYQRFVYSFTWAAKQEGLELVKSQRVPANKTLVDCLEFRLPNNNADSSVRCVVENSRVVIFYYGHPKYAPIFYSMLRSISIANAVNETPTKTEETTAASLMLPVTGILKRPVALPSTSWAGTCRWPF